MDSSSTPRSCSRHNALFAFARGTSRSTMRAANWPSSDTYAAISSGSSGANNEFTSRCPWALAAFEPVVPAEPATPAVAVAPVACAPGSAASAACTTPAALDAWAASACVCSTGMNPDSPAIAYAKRPTRTLWPFTSPDTPLPESSTMFFTTGYSRPCPGRSRSAHNRCPAS